MSKLAAGLLLILGLGIGLWLGFNPKAHQEVVQTWNRTTTAVAHSQTNTAAKTPTVRLPTATAKPNSQPKISLASLWKQITIAFETLWHSIQRAWVGVTASIRNVK